MSIGIALIFISLFIFTRPAIFSSWDFTSTGQIGDTIGGTTAPLIGLVSMLLVFYTFQEQVKANKIQSDALADEKKRNKVNEDIKFIYERLTDAEFIRRTKVESWLKELESITSDYFNHRNDTQENYSKFLNGKTIGHFEEFLYLDRYFVLFLILEKKIVEIAHDIDYLQLVNIQAVVEIEKLKLDQLSGLRGNINGIVNQWDRTMFDLRIIDLIYRWDEVNKAVSTIRSLKTE